MSASLVIMAAGLGSRYGGSKQVDGIGPHGEILMEYAVYDALQAGFNKVVFIIKPEMEAMMEQLCVAKLRRQTAGNGQGCTGGVCLSGFFLTSTILHIASGAGEALWNRTCAAVRGRCGARAFLCHQCG